MLAIVEYIYALAKEEGPPPLWIVSCHRGRHRSVASAILICLLFVYLGCNVELDWHIYCAEHVTKECKEPNCRCHNPVYHNPVMQGILMKLWDKCAAGSDSDGVPQVPARGDLAVQKGAVLPILSTVSALLEHGFCIDTGAGYLAPQQHETVTILFDGFWSKKEDERLWLFVQDSTGQRGWIHRGMVLQPPVD